ncbi:MAG: hypothetical protein FWG53_08900 [Clostridiales bacterium]|nr:hypothetical protein [Clostridiales bacterium]
MAILSSLKNEYRTLSVVGMAKNAGKTTTLNYLIEEAADECVTLGVTSTGRDGESVDLVTGTEKPKVYLYPGTIVSVPTSLFESASAGLEILRMTKYHTSIGPVMICRVVDSGYVQVAGPVLTSDHKLMYGEMMSCGAEIILIDGAVDRKSIAAPETSDAIILATGAVLSRNMKKVAEETAYLAGLYGLPELDDEWAVESFKGCSKITVAGKGKTCGLDIETGLDASGTIDDAIDEDTEYVYIPGALTSSVVRNIHPKKFSHVTFVMKNPTKIFLSFAEWQRLVKKGFVAKVLKNIKIAAISVNPVSPEGYSFQHENLIEIMEKAVPHIRIIDVKLQ